MFEQFICSGFQQKPSNAGTSRENTNSPGSPGMRKHHGKGKSPRNSPQRDRDSAAGRDSPVRLRIEPNSPERDRSPHPSPKGSPRSRKGKTKTSLSKVQHENSVVGSNASASNVGVPFVNSAARRSPQKQYDSQSSGSNTPSSLGFTPSPPKSPLKRTRVEGSENVNDIQELDHHGSVSRISPQSTGAKGSPGKIESPRKTGSVEHRNPHTQKSATESEAAQVTWLFGNDKKSAKNEQNAASSSGIIQPEVTAHDRIHCSATMSRKREHSLSRSPGQKRTRTDDVSDVISDLDRVQVQSAESSSSHGSSVERSAIEDGQNDSVVIVDSPHVSNKLEERRIARAKRTGNGSLSVTYNPRPETEGLKRLDCVTFHYGTTITEHLISYVLFRL